MFNLTRSARRPVSKTNQFPAMTTIATTALLLSPFFVQADPDPASSKLLRVAESNALELGSAVADNHWTRIEFSKVYVDPIVVVEPSVDNGSSTYIVGIRNVDAMGFEMILKNCDTVSGAPLQETVNFSVVDNSQLASPEQADTAISQRFAWGECATSSSS